MKLRKPLAILLILALSLGVAPITSVSGAEQSTAMSGRTLTPTPTSEAFQVVDDTINVTIKERYPIQINPYGMTINYPDGSGTSADSIVASPLYIENNTDLQVEVTAKATAVPYGTVELDSKPTRYTYEHYPLENPDEVPSDERVYLYLQMMELAPGDSVENEEWESEPKEVITQDGGSKELKVTMPVGGGAALKIGGNTSLPTFDSYNKGVWRQGNGFDVNIVLDFLPKMEEDESYPVTFVVSSSSELFSSARITIDLEGGKAEADSSSRLKFTKEDSGAKVVNATESLTFTVKTADEYKGMIYRISRVYIVHKPKNGGTATMESLFPTEEEKGTTPIVWTKTINASKVKTDEEDLSVRIILDYYNYG